MTCRRSQVRVLYRPPKQEPLTLVRGFFVASSTNPRQSRTVQDSNRAALRSRVSNQPSGLLLSPRFPTPRNVYQERCRQTIRSGDFFRGGGTGREQHVPSAAKAIKAPVQRRRPQPAAETGRSCWGRVLIFQSPAKGLQKNQQTQPVRPLTARFRCGSQPVGMSNKRTTVHPGEMELALFVFYPDAVQSVCDKGLPV